MSDTTQVFLTTDQLAERWQVAPGSLVNDRMIRRGVSFVKIGERVRYRLADVLAFESAQLRVAK